MLEAIKNSWEESWDITLRKWHLLTEYWYIFLLLAVITALITWGIYMIKEKYF